MNAIISAFSYPSRATPLLDAPDNFVVDVVSLFRFLSVDGFFAASEWLVSQ